MEYKGKKLYYGDVHDGDRYRQEYADSIRSLAKKYSDKIEIYTGFEADYISGVCCPSFENYRDFSPDYLIGSIHFVPGKKGFIEADGSFDDVRKGINSFFDGDIKAAVCEYFALEREMIEKGSFTFIGHPDLIKKQNIIHYYYCIILIYSNRHHHSKLHDHNT